jgi:hypothetical protein
MIPNACIKNLEAFKLIPSKNKFIILGGELCEILPSNRNLLYRPIIDFALSITKNTLITTKKGVLNAIVSEYDLPVFYNIEEIYYHLKESIENTGELYYIFIQTNSFSNIGELLKLYFSTPVINEEEADEEAEEEADEEAEEEADEEADDEAEEEADDEAEEEADEEAEEEADEEAEEEADEEAEEEAEEEADEMN